MLYSARDFDKDEVFRNLKRVYQYNQLPCNEVLNCEFNNYFHGQMMRDFIIKEFGIFGMACQESIINIKNFINNRACYDVCAGAGYLSYCLSKYGVNVKAYDKYQKSYGCGNLKEKNRWHEVTEVDSLTIIPEIRCSVIIICWPDLYSDFAYEAVKASHESNDILYIGEYEGCTANDEFFEKIKLEEMDISWYNWPSCHDNVFKVNF